MTLFAIGLKILAEARRCPFCGDPVMSVDNDGRLFLADGFDFTSAHDRIDFTPHTCLGYVAHVAEARGAPR